MENIEYAGELIAFKDAGRMSVDDVYEASKRLSIFYFVENMGYYLRLHEIEWATLKFNGIKFRMFAESYFPDIVEKYHLQTNDYKQLSN